MSETDNKMSETDNKMSEKGVSVLGKIYNHKKDKLDGKEDKFGIEHHTLKTTQLPISFDLRTDNPYFPGVIDQGLLGSCCSNSLSVCLKYCLEHETKKTNSEEWTPSRLFIYYWGRFIENEPINEDTGISIYGGIQSIMQYGACSEVNWPYIIANFAEKPSAGAIVASKTHCKNFKFLSVPQNLVHIQQALVCGFPISCGIQIYESFESQAVSESGNVPTPNVLTEKLLGGHATTIISYNSDQTFTCMNSWGTSWGNSGFFNISAQDYILDPNLASDFWTIQYYQP